jgi:hypothetical protein
MTEFKCDTRSHGNFLSGKKQSVVTGLYRLYNYCSASAAVSMMMRRSRGEPAHLTCSSRRRIQVLESLPRSTEVEPYGRVPGEERVQW